MDKELFVLFQKELIDEAKRLVPIVYTGNDLFFFKTSEYKKNIKKKYKLFSVDIELLLVGLCGMKHDGEDWENDNWINNKYDIKKSIEHHKKVLEYDEEEFNANIQETIDNVAKDIVDNYDNYMNKSLYEVLPGLVEKYMNSHNDSVEHAAFVLYLNNSLKKYGKYLPTTNLYDLKDI